MTALVALVFTWMSVEGTRAELRIAEQGQITNRFNAAIRNLGSDSPDVRLGGIHGLQRIMKDSARDQPTIVLVLTAYARQHAPKPDSGFAKEPESDLLTSVWLAADVQAVLSVLADRSADHDGQAWLDLRDTDLRGAEVAGRGEVIGQPSAPGKPENRAAFRFAHFDGADLRHSQFAGVDLRDSIFNGSNLAGAQFYGVDLSGAMMEKADLTHTLLQDVNLTRVDLNDAKLHQVQGASGVQGESTVNLTNATLVAADLTGALLESATLRNSDLTGADLWGARLGDANLAKADLTGADLTKAHLRGADFTGGDLTNADLRGADLIGADLANADLRGADLTGADLTSADLRGARLAGVKLSGAKLNNVTGLPPSLRP